MNCSEFELELEQQVETRRNRLSDAAEQHIDGCAVCRHLWQNHRLIEVALSALPRVQPPVGLVDSVLWSLLREHSSSESNSFVVASGRRTNRRSKWIIVSAAAACLFAIVCLGWRSPQEAPQIASRPLLGRSAEHASVEVATSVVAVFNDLRAEYRELAAETSASARDFAAVLPPGVVSVWNASGRQELETEQAHES